ncbi:N-acetylglutamate synthase-like GNAT family acetyltransferase [Sediminihabitans luteus]|uniref:N-acetylglutamate synthase-like GNAT family acetyltransferase n=1 Tax=Sediminihabitans luteus TaxID=1138585 RepID=A0A2M9D115_9CELL|nr:GNAT family N-acetyltransferase [Sediminihabitans luteus]PJJ77850.1 N-acetylglutamate synthase-like GNAT family acetyltransferase [Sediminihabitans luteus]GII99792.1 hypothetical protein Slu03_21700 [Sediminihabitans luteus]
MNAHPPTDAVIADVAPLVVTAARVDDAAALWPLVQQLAATATPDRGAFERTLRDLVDAPTSLVAVARTAAGDVRGYLLAHRQPTFFAGAPVVWVQEVVVDEGSRRGGVGRRLMAHAEAWAAEQRAAYVSLASRRAGDFYAALGYADSATFYKLPLA